MVGRESWADASFFLVVRRLVSISGGGDGRAELIRMLLLAIIVLLFVAFVLLLFVVVDLVEIAVMLSNHSMMRLAIDCFSMDISSESMVRTLHPGSTELADKGNSSEDDVAAA